MCNRILLARAALVATLIAFNADGVKSVQPSKYAVIEIESGEASFSNVQFSPDGERLSYVTIRGTGECIATWDVKTKQQLKQVHKAESRIGGIAYSPGGRLFAVADGTAIYTIDVENGDRTRLYLHEGDKDRVRPELSCVRYSRDGARIVSADGHGFIKVWDVEKKSVAVAIRCVPKGGVMDLVLIPDTDRALVFVSQWTPDPLRPNAVPATEYKAVLADLKAGTAKPVTDPEPLEYYASFYHGSDVSPDGKLLVLPGGLPGRGGIRILATATLKTELDLKCPLDPAACRFSDSGRLLFVGGSKKGGMPLVEAPPGEVAILDRATNNWVSHIRVLDQKVSSMSFSPKHNLLAVASGKTGSPITIWNISPVMSNLQKGKEK
ncbi:MAG: repeat-like protein [Gemmataceae bacterium]|nr:repeat-like protein [Gemmataceae bacterium]